MIKLLNNPYPFLYGIKRNVIIAGAVGVFVIILNSLMADDKGVVDFLVLSKMNLSFLFGFITFFSIVITFEALLRLVIPEAAKEAWT